MPPQKKTIFVISPIGKPNSEIRTFYNKFLKILTDKFGSEEKSIIKGYKIIRGDQIVGSKLIMNQVMKELREAPICIAELSQPNPNVYFELGIRMALGKDFILIKQTNVELPFDVVTTRSIVYDDLEWENAEKLVEEIKKYIIDIDPEAARSHETHRKESDSARSSDSSRDDIIKELLSQNKELISIVVKYHQGASRANRSVDVGFPSGFDESGDRRLGDTPQ